MSTTIPAEVNKVAAAQSLRTLLRIHGADLAYEQVLRQLEESGLACTRDEYESAWQSLHGGLTAKGTRRTPPGSSRPASSPLPTPQPEPEEEPTMNEATTTANGNGKHTADEPEGKFERAHRLRELVQSLGQTAKLRELIDAAKQADLPHSPSAIDRARVAVFGRPSREKPPTAAAPVTAPPVSPRPAPPPTAPVKSKPTRPAAATPSASASPAVLTGNGLLASIATIRLQLDALEKVADVVPSLKLKLTQETTPS